jgi:hypothetical protein
MRHVKFRLRKDALHVGSKAGLAVLLGFLYTSAAAGQSSSYGEFHSCLEAARQALGPAGEVARCGHLTRATVLETVSVIRLKQFPGTADGGIAVSKLVVLRQVSAGQWRAALTIDRMCARNDAGYLGDGYIIDVPEYARALAGYYVWYSNYIDTEEKKPGFAIVVQDLRWDENEEAEGTSWEVAWNPAVGRFQYYTENEDPPGFRPEKKNLPRLSEYLKSHGCAGAGKPPCDK